MGLAMIVFAESVDKSDSDRSGAGSKMPFFKSHSRGSGGVDGGVEYGVEGEEDGLGWSSERGGSGEGREGGGEG